MAILTGGFFKSFTNLIKNNMVVSYLISALNLLKAIHVGTLAVKIKATITLGVMLSPVVFIWEKISQWGLTNSDYILTVLLAIIVDHALGTWKHLKIDKDFTIKKNLTGLVSKIGLVVCCGLMFEGMNVIVHEDSILKDYLVIVTRLIVFLYPAGSALGNSSIISGGKFPPQVLLDRLSKFQTNLNPKSIMVEPENQE